MSLDAWLSAAVADARRRGLSELEPLLEGLARATRVLRAADFNESPLSPPSDTGPDLQTGRGPRP